MPTTTPEPNAPPQTPPRRPRRDRWPPPDHEDPFAFVQSIDPLAPRRPRRHRWSPPDHEDPFSFVQSIDLSAPRPPKRPAVYLRLSKVIREVSQTLVQICQELEKTHRRLDAGQRVPSGRLFSLTVQERIYRQQLGELNEWKSVVNSYIREDPQNALALEEELLCDSDQEDLVLPPPRDEPIFEYASDSDGPDHVQVHVGMEPDVPAVRFHVQDMERYLQDHNRQNQAQSFLAARQLSLTSETYSEVVPLPPAHPADHEEADEDNGATQYESDMAYEVEEHAGAYANEGNPGRAIRFSFSNSQTEMWRRQIEQTYGQLLSQVY